MPRFNGSTQKQSAFFYEFMLAVAMSACRCGYFVNMNPLVEPSDKMGSEGVRQEKSALFRLPFRLKTSSK